MEKRKLLVVDDEQHILDMYAQAFSRAGYVGLKQRKAPRKRLISFRRNGTG
jgi:DNA-binding NtrC family response regulator